jgi:hypothetical protein
LREATQGWEYLSPVFSWAPPKRAETGEKIFKAKSVPIFTQAKSVPAQNCGKQKACPCSAFSKNGKQKAHAHKIGAWDALKP